MTDVHHNQDPRPNRPDATALGAFFALAEVWDLNTDQQIVLLGNPSRSTYFKWKKEKGDVSGDTEERISHLMATFKAQHWTLGSEWERYFCVVLTPRPRLAVVD